MSDLLHQNFDTVQNNLQPAPMTVAAAATITPQTLITFLTGTTAIATIVAPVTGQHILALISTDSGTTNATVTTGNIIKASTFVQNRALLMTYDPIGAKYYPSY